VERRDSDITILKQAKKENGALSRPFHKYTNVFLGYAAAIVSACPSLFISLVRS